MTNSRNDVWKRLLWPVAKAGLAAAVLGAVGWRFYGDLHSPHLEHVQLRWSWLMLAGGLYLGGLSVSASFWQRLLVTFGQSPRWTTCFRAYFIGHLGKYIPGKAWALLLRGALVRGPQVRMGVAILTAFYEVLTTMAAGAFLAAMVFFLHPPGWTGLEWHPLWIGLVLLIVVGTPLWPGIFNFLARIAVRRLPGFGAEPLPALRTSTLIQGLIWTTGGWCLIGLSLWALLQGVLAQPPPLTLSMGLHLCAVLSLAYVAGFLALFMPSGLGVREFFLAQLLGFVGPTAQVVVAILLLRLVWTAAEAGAALLWYFVPSEPRPLGSGLVHRSLTVAALTWCCQWSTDLRAAP